VIEHRSLVQTTSAQAAHDPGPETRMTRRKTARRHVRRLWMLLLMTTATVVSAAEVRPGQ
jgi:hypothetical protein